MRLGKGVLQCWRDDGTQVHLLQVPLKAQVDERIALRVSTSWRTREGNIASRGAKPACSILIRFPKDKELVNKWLSVLGMEGRVLHGSSCICSRHFKEKDFRYSLVGGNRFLKRGAIPSLFLDGEYRNDRSSDSQEEDASAEENRSTNIADEHIAAEITGGVALDAIATKSRLEQARKSDYRSSSDIKRKSDALKESKACDDVRFASRRCRSESRAPER